jgi:hypothetical protein
LVFSVRSNRTRGLRSTQSYSSGLPNTNDGVTGLSGSSAPARSRPSTPSLNISDHTARPCRAVNAVSTASGTAPMPICSVAPSGTSVATRSPIVCDMSLIARGAGEVNGSSTSIA